MAEANVGSTELIPISEHSRMLLAIHKAMRADRQRLIAAAAALPDSDGAAAALGRAFAALVSLIHDHHWTEDDVIYPFLMARVEPSSRRDAAGRRPRRSRRIHGPDQRPLSAARPSAQLRSRPTPEATSPTKRQPSTALVDHLDREEDLSSPHSNRPSPRPSSTRCRNRRPRSRPTAICASPCPGCWQTPLPKRRSTCARPLLGCSASSKIASGSRISCASWHRYTDRPIPDALAYSHPKECRPHRTSAASDHDHHPGRR